MATRQNLSAVFLSDRSLTKLWITSESCRTRDGIATTMDAGQYLGALGEPEPSGAIFEKDYDIVSQNKDLSDED